MKTYRKKNEILVWQWTGDKSIIDEISEVIKPYKYLNIGVSSDPNVLFVSRSSKKDTYSNLTSTDFVHIGNYITFDINDYERTIACYNEDYFNTNYVEL